MMQRTVWYYMWRIYVFRLRVYLKIGGVNSCVWDDAVEVEADSEDSALMAAKKEFVRKHPPLHGFTDYDKIESCGYEFG